MPRRSKKKVTEMTTDELARLVFPKKVIEEVKRIARESDAKKGGGEASESSHKES